MITVLRFLLVAALLLNGPPPAAIGHPVAGQVHAHDATTPVVQKHEHCASGHSQGAQSDGHERQRAPDTRTHHCGGAACHCGCAGPLLGAFTMLAPSMPVYEPLPLASSNAVRPPQVRSAPPFRPPAT